MTNRFMLSVAAAALIAGTGFAGAQGTGGSHEGAGGGSSVQQSSPSTGHAGTSQGQTGHETSPSSGMKATQSEQKSPGAGKNERTEDMGQKSKGMSSENDRAKGGGKDMKAEGREGRDGNMKAEGREDRDGKMKAEGREGRDNNMKAEGREGRDNNMKAEGREGRDGNMKAEGREGRDGNMKAEEREGSRTQTTTGQAGAGAKLSTEQRTKITSVIREQRVAPAEHVNFSISVGTRVPREVRFHPLPAEVVTVYPEWRGYEFFLVRDEIVVVDPRSLEIVAVLPA
jgi:Protein of unknown function (DUF1236)